jgi:Transposase DDE domain
VDKTTGLRFDQTVVTVGFYPQRHYPDVLRRIGYRDSKTGKKLVFLTNNFTVPALTIAQLYHARWQIELFFKWLKQHLRIKAFYGTSPNAVRPQIWSAIAVYRLVANSQKAAASGFEPLHHSQILSLTLFEKTPIRQALSQPPPRIQVAHHTKSPVFTGLLNRTVVLKNVDLIIEIIVDLIIGLIIIATYVPNV